jgi:hypothetical protein
MQRSVTDSATFFPPGKKQCFKAFLSLDYSGCCLQMICAKGYPDKYDK